MKERKIFRISFYNRGDIYELYARSVRHSDLYAFVDVEDIIFGERSAIVIDPAEERLKSEFQGVRRTSIPLQSIIRIDEVEREGSNRIIEGDGKPGKVTPFPAPPGTGRKADP
jgi:hypothetical protein